MKICALSSSTCDKRDRFLCNSFWRLLFPETEHARSCKFPCSIKSWFLQFGPINRHRCITVPPSFRVFCALFLYIAEWLTGSLFFKAETISGDSSSNFTCMQRKLLERWNKTSSKMYKHLLQQKMHQKMHSSHDIFCIRHFCLNITKEFSPIKCNIYF